MSKYVSRSRLERAIAELAAFGREVHSQHMQHILPLLALLERGVAPGREAVFEEDHDFDFWDRYFTVDPSSQDGKYYDPFRGERRIAGHPHSNVATARKSTFRNSWKAGSLSVKDSVSYWSLAPDYLDIVTSKSLSKAGNVTRVPLLDLIAWLRRTDEFADTLTTKDLINDFARVFNLQDEGLDTLFRVREEGHEFFGDQPITPEDVLLFVGEPPTAGVDTPGGLVPRFSPDLDSISTSMAFENGVTQQAVTALSVGSHLILAGPPGTGKSTLAENLAAQATASGYVSGYRTITATSDWTSFDTIGGYMPSGEGNQLEFTEGLVLRSIREDSWCIIDELNRANIDRAVGALITLLAGSEESAVVELPFRHVVGEGDARRSEPVRIRRDVTREKSGEDEDSGDYVIGRNWRLIATMNTFDRNNLFPLTAAFARRFATVFVGVPPSRQVLDALGVAEGVARDMFAVLLTTHDDEWKNPQPLGPAIVKDCWRYVAMRTQRGDESQRIPTPEVVREAALEAIRLYAVPQYNGLEPEEWHKISDRLAKASTRDVQEASRIEIHLSVRARLDAALSDLQGAW